MALTGSLFWGPGVPASQRRHEVPLVVTNAGGTPAVPEERAR